MTECHNEVLRDQLPLLARGELTPVAAATLRGHVAACVDCAAELAVLERAGHLFAAATPRIDTAAILAKLPAAPGTRPVLTVSRGSRRPLGMPRYVLAAAASLVLVATLSLGAIRDAVFGGGSATDVGPDTGASVVAAAPSALVGGHELDDFNVDELETLLSELDQLEATVAAEPTRIQAPVSTVPEVL
jgi:anti-sigma factor RsiW